MAKTIQFLLNDREVETACSPGLLVLDYLRKHEQKTGTKEGCKEGDCGACTVLVGELNGETIRYKPVTSCLVPLGEMEGKHVVSVEGLNMEELSPVQSAIVQEGGTQCGFCTPGIVVSLNALLIDDRKPVDLEGVKYALSGHLCRCTGYRSLKNSAEILSKQLGEVLSKPNRIEALVDAGVIPEYFRDAPQKLKALRNRIASSRDGSSNGSPPEFFIAGGTDLYVQVGEDIPGSSVELLNLHPEMKGVRKSKGKYRVGALTTFEEFSEDPEMLKIMPDLPHFAWLIASWQIRNRATLSGNIINASPIGDITALLLALETELVLKEGDSERVVPMTSFYKGYKQLDKKKGEILTEIVFPEPEPGTKINFEKVSKRTCLDIASVNSGMKIRVEDGVIQDAHFTLGGVAPIPYYLTKASAFLQGKPLDMDTAWEAIEISQDEITPIDDVRGTAKYKALLGRQFLIAHLTKLYPDEMKVRDYYETY